MSDGPLGPDVDPAAVDGTVRELLHLLGKRHTMAVLYVFARDPGPWRFGELQNRVEYTRTAKAEELKPAFRHLYERVYRHEGDS